MFRTSWRVGVPAVVCVTAVLLVLGCGGASTPPQGSDAVAAPDQAALEKAHTQLLAALSAADPEAFGALLDTSPALLIFHPMLEDRFDGVEMIKKNLPIMFAKLGKATWTEVHTMAEYRGDVAWITYYVLVEAANLPTPFAGRGTEIWNHTPEGWRLIHAHWSETPTYPEGTS